MKSKTLIYSLPVVFVCLVAFSFMTMTTNFTDPRSDSAPLNVIQWEEARSPDYEGDALSYEQLQTDTTPGFGWPYPTIFNWNYRGIPNVNAGTVGAIRFNNRFYLNRWNAAISYRYAS